MKLILASWFSLARTDRFRRLGREVVWISLGQAIALLGSLVGVRLLTEILTPVAYGELALGITVATLVNQVVLGPLSNGFTRFYAPAREKGGLGGYFVAVRNLVSAATAIIFLLIPITIAILIFAGRPGWITIAIGSYIFAIISGYNSILSGIQNAARQRSVVALHQGMESWARFLVAAGVILWLGASSTMAMAGYAIAATIVLVSQYVFFRKTVPINRKQNENGRNWAEKILYYSWPMAVTGVMSWGFFSSQRWALELFCSTEDVGYFSAIFQVGYTPFSLLGGMLLTLMMPIIFGRAGDGEDKQKVKSISKSIVKFCLAAAVIVLLSSAVGARYHDVIFRILVAKQFSVVSHYLPYAILAAGLLQISLVLSSIILIDAKTSRLLPLNTIGNSLIIVITFMCTRFYGMDGLFFAMVSGSMIHLSWNIYNVKKVLIHDGNS